MVAKMQQQQQQQPFAAGLASGSQQPQQQQLYQIPSQMSKYMNVNSIQQHRALQAAQKRPRSPSPAPQQPAAVYAPVTYPPNKYQAAAYAAGGKPDYSAASECQIYRHRPS